MLISLRTCFSLSASSSSSFFLLVSFFLHPHFYARLSLLGVFYSIFDDDYQVLASALYAGMWRSFGREPVSRTEQRTECKFSSSPFFSSSSYISILFSLVSRHSLFSDQHNNFSSTSSATHKMTDPTTYSSSSSRSLSLSSFCILNKLTIFFL